MSDVFLFIIGCLVSLVVASAVGLLMWGAANEPRGGLLPSRKTTDPKTQARSAGTAERPTSSSLASKAQA